MKSTIAMICMIAAVIGQAAGQTPDIWTAASQGNLEAVRQHLAAGADVNAADRNGYTPLDAARHQADWMPDKTAVVAFLREKGGKPRGNAPAGDRAASRGRRTMSSELHINDAAPDRAAPPAAHEAIHPAWSLNWPQFRGPGALGDITLGVDETRNAHIAWCQKQAGPYNVSPSLHGDAGDRP